MARFQFFPNKHPPHPTLNPHRLIGLVGWRLILHAGTTCSTKGSQNQTLFTKRHDNNLFLQPKNKNVKMLWSLPILKSRILGLIWQGTAYFFQRHATMVDPSWIQRSKREMPNANDPFLVLNWRHELLILIFQLFPIFHIVFAVVNLFSWFFNIISSVYRSYARIELLRWRLLSCLFLHNQNSLHLVNKIFVNDEWIGDLNKV